MGLVDSACDRFFDMAREHWRKQGFDASMILLDEPSSNLDSLNEGIVLKSLKESAGKY